VSNARVSNVADLISARSAIRSKGALLGVHYAIGEFCDVDGHPGYDGPWPPSNVTADILVSLALNKPLAQDTFVSGGFWFESKFSAVMSTGSPPTGTLSSEAAKGGVPLYSLTCHAGSAADVVQGVTIGDYRIKCDVTLAPGPYRIDQNFKSFADAETKAATIGCSKANRKMAMLAFLAGAAVGSATQAGASDKWQSVAVGAASYEYVKTFDVRYANGTVVASPNVIFQVKDIGAIFPEKKNLPAWVADAKAVLVVFDVGRDVMADDNLQIYWDPSIGFASDPATLDTGVAAEDMPATSTTTTKGKNSAVATVVSLLAMLIATLALLI